MNYISGDNRNQMQFFALEEMVSEDSWSRVIDLFVDLLPIESLGFKHASLQKEGRPPYDPTVMLKLYMYGYRHGIRSSRKLEHACKVNIELWWLLKGLKPSFRSIAYFRKDNAAAFKSAFRHFVLMLQDMELVEGETIAIDSFKIRAQNSIANNFSQKKIDRHIEYIDQKIEEYEQQLETADVVDQDQILKKIEVRKKRRDEYKELESKLIESGELQISLTDTDAKSILINRNIIEVGYRVQAATDKKNKLFVHADIDDVTDKRALAPTALSVKTLLNLKQFNTLSDAGYTTGDQLQICKEAGITTYSSPMPSTSPSNDCIPTSEFQYKKDIDCYVCPAGEFLKRRGTWVNRGHYRASIYKTKACEHCQLRKQCTQNKSGRVIERTEYQDVIDENNNRVVENIDYYRIRQQIIEHQFGTLKRQWGFTFTLMKGKENVLTEVNILMIVYNLLRSTSIVGKKDLRARLKAMLATIFKSFEAFKAEIRTVANLWKADIFFSQSNFRTPTFS